MTLALIFESVGVGEWFVLLAVVLIVLGPQRLPETARKIGAWYSKFRRAAEGFKRQLMEMDTEINRTIDDASREVADATGIPYEPDDSSNPDYGPGYDDDYGYGYYGHQEDDSDSGIDGAAASGEVASAGSSESAPADAGVAAQEPQKKKSAGDLASVKITVSPGPKPAGVSNGDQNA
jgi:Tat protein translocase TatB subunit